MRRSVEFIAGVLAGPAPPLVCLDDFGGPHGPAIRVCQRHGFLATDPEPLRVPSCPHCGDGVPVQAGPQLLCGSCLTTIDPLHLTAWRFDVPAFLTWLARELRLDGDVRRVDGDLWQLGGRTDDGIATEYFFGRTRPTPAGRSRLLAYRNAVFVRPLPADPIDGFGGRTLSMTDVLTMTDDAIAVTESGRGRGGDGATRFDAATGALWVGGGLAGEVPVGSKQYHFLACLAESLDRYVAYADLKHEVLRRSGSRDTTEEATFCQKLKGRVKKQWVPGIDRLIATTNKGDGYRLRGRVGPWETR